MKREKLAAVFFAAAIVFGLAGSAGAVDGTIEINQATVLAAGGFPYTIAASGSYRLTGNLTLPANTNGIIVTASNVTIDLNGFTITGAGSSSTGTGIESASVISITVENGTITGFFTGVNAGTNGIVKSVHAVRNGSGIAAGFSGMVQGCTATGNTKGFGIAGAGNTVISGNTANANAVGIECQSSGCLITNNVINSNTGPAISAADGTTAYGWNVMNGDAGGISGGLSMGGGNTNACGASPC